MLIEIINLKDKRVWVETFLIPRIWMINYDYQIILMPLVNNFVSIYMF